jgi:flagellar motor protein MotB
MGWALRALCTLAVLGLARCAATVREEEYREALNQLAADYELELKRGIEDRRRVETACEEERAAAVRRRADLEERLVHLGEALADKQRVLDEMSGRRELEAAKAAAKGRALAPARPAELRGRLLALLGAQVQAHAQASEKAGAAWSRSLEVREEKDGVLVRVPADRLFARGSTLLSGAEPAALVGAIAAALRELPGTRIEVGVHTDIVEAAALPARTASAAPGRDDAWGLGTRQGLAVLRALAATGLDPSRLSVASYGQFHPLVPNDSSADRARNRRVELRVVLP